MENNNNTDNNAVEYNYYQTTDTSIFPNYDEPSNVFLGTLGALLGIIPGLIIWVILDQVGFIAGLAGYVMLMGAFKVYEILGKKLDKKGVIICVVISFIGIIFADFFSLAWAAYSEFKEIYDVTFLDCIKIMPNLILSDGTIATGFIFNLLIGLGLSAWSCFRNVAMALKS